MPEARPLCRDREADERAALAALNAAIAAPVPVAPTIATADPQVTAVVRLTTWAGFRLAADDVVNLRLVLMAMLPNIAGLVLMFGVALAFPIHLQKMEVYSAAVVYPRRSARCRHPTGRE